MAGKTRITLPRIGKDEMQYGETKWRESLGNDMKCPKCGAVMESPDHLDDGFVQDECECGVRLCIYPTVWRVEAIEDDEEDDDE